jgi:hypothetical protein
MFRISGTFPRKNTRWQKGWAARRNAAEVREWPISNWNWRCEAQRLCTSIELLWTLCPQELQSPSWGPDSSPLGHVQTAICDLRPD